MNGRILSEVGSFHLEYYDLAHAANDQKWLDRAFGIRDCLANTRTMDGLFFNRLSRPKKNENDEWYSTEGIQTKKSYFLTFECVKFSEIFRKFFCIESWISLKEDQSQWVPREIRSTNI